MPVLCSGPGGALTAAGSDLNSEPLPENGLVLFCGRPPFARYRGGSLWVTGSCRDHSSARDHSSQCSPVGVDWRLTVTGAVDGVGMALTRRPQFAGLIERQRQTACRPARNDALGSLAGDFGSSALVR
ncbi:MAG: hypothetical protein J2P48_22795 [Alphaproteobacteria bacterium]|nr:hypothetical protein [Alphaproteobacteria bacterium]